MNAPRDPLLEKSYYRNEALRATSHGKNELALCWRLAGDAVGNFFKQNQGNYILSAPQRPFVDELARLIESTQEADHRITKKSSAHGVDSSDWIFNTKELQEAAKSYRHWMACSEAQGSSGFEQEIRQATNAVAIYETVAPAVAFFAQEAVTYFKKAHALFKKISPLEFYRWKIAADAAVEVAVIYLHVEASTSRNNKILIHHWKEAARYGEHAFHFRIKAAMATAQGKEPLAIDWSLAAHAATNVCEAHEKLLELFPSGNDFLINCWSDRLHAAEMAMQMREKVALDQKKESSWRKAAFASEHYYDCLCNVIETYESKNSIARDAWKKGAAQAKQVALFWKRVAQHETRRISCSRVYWQQKAMREESKNKKCTLALLRTEIFFCLPKQLLPYEKWPVVRDDAESFYKINCPVFYSWIYQTGKFLEEAGVACKLATYPMPYGINITLAHCLSPDFGKTTLLSEDLFLVDVVADLGKHAAAHFYLLQNSADAQQTPHSLFVPHWPQAGLIPRDPERGTRFENVFFFGESQNLAPELRSQQWAERLQRELGLHFEIRGRDQWHHYDDADCAMAIRDFSSEPHFYKPATKLYNAWLAGVPFIGGCDSAYASDGQSEKNYLIAHSLEEVFQHLKRLKENVSLRSKLVENGRDAGKAFTKEATLKRWKNLVEETLPRLALEYHRAKKR